MGDHPPITPCRSAGVHELSGDAARIYEFVVRHFIASVSHDAVWQSTKIDFEIAELSPKGRFYLTGKQLVTPGFLAVLLHKEYGDKPEDGDEDDEEERTIPEFKVGEIIPLLRSNPGVASSKVGTAPAAPVWASLDIKEKKTVAPGYLTESELLGMMEKHGIGTDASMATHIENIQKRNYVRLESGRRLIPNKLGLVLVQGYHSIDSGLVLPKVRSDIEGQCLQIAKGLAEKDVVLKRAIETFENKFAYFVENIGRMDILFASSFSKLEDVGQAFTRCGLTRYAYLSNRMASFSSVENRLPFHSDATCSLFQARLHGFTIALPRRCTHYRLVEKSNSGADAHVRFVTLSYVCIR